MDWLLIRLLVIPPFFNRQRCAAGLIFLMLQICDETMKFSHILLSFIYQQITQTNYDLFFYKFYKFGMKKKCSCSSNKSKFHTCSHQFLFICYNLIQHPTIICRNKYYIHTLAASLGRPHVAATQCILARRRGQWSWYKWGAVKVVTSECISSIKTSLCF